MKETNLFERLIDKILYEQINRIEYYFAKRWLDKVFGDIAGKQEYWGDYIFYLISDSEILKKSKTK